MNRAWRAIIFVAGVAIGQAQTYTITTAAGGASPHFLPGTGDGGAASSAGLGNPNYDVALDGQGNLYIAAGGLIRKVHNGTISTVAGGGTNLGEGVPALQAALSPTAIVVDSAGDILIADTAYGSYRVRKVDTSGIITTIAGGAKCCTLGDGGPATRAYLEVPYGLALDGSGNLYIAQAGPGNNLIRKVNAAGNITTIAGGGPCCALGDGGPATSAYLTRPTGVAVDGAGNVYIADTGANRVRKVSGGVITTVAGTGAATTSGDGGPATQAGVDRPWHIALDAAGNLLITEFYDARLRMVTPGGTISTAAGDGVAGYSGDGGPASSAELAAPAGIVVGAGGIYVADDNPAAPRVRLLTAGTLGAGITLATSPAGLTAALDGGAPCATPCAFTLVPGSVHTIAVVSPQGFSAGTQYSFSGWSDGGALSHAITVPSTATTYTASFQTQYQLTTLASPAAGGSVTPASGGYYAAGASVSLSATPNAGFTFGGWSGGVSGSANPQSITMSGPQSVTALFAASGGTCSIGLGPGAASLPATGTSSPAACPAFGQPNCGFVPEVPVSFTVTPSASCGAWTATSSNAQFLQILSGAGGSGPGTVTFVLLNNTHTLPQNYTITVSSAGGASTYPVTQAGSGDSQVYREVYALYEQLLGRDPDSAGFAFWTGAGGAGLGQMADSFLTSPEAYNSNFAVLAAYQAALNRPPSFAQFTAAVSAVRAGTQTVGGLFTSLVGPGYSATTLYQNLLGRTPVASEVSSYNANGASSAFEAIAGYPSTTQVGAPSNEFQSTGAYHTDHTNSLYLDMLYYTILSRDPDPAGFNFWLGIANTGGPGLLFQGSSGYGTRIQILGPGTPNQGYIGSPEFQGLFSN